MGSATVDIPERWRPWLDNGVTHILGPLSWVDEFQRETPEGLEGERSGSDIGAEVLTAVACEASSSPQARAETAQNAAPVSSEAIPERAPESLPGHFKRASTELPKKELSLTTSGQASAAQRPLPTPTWPEIWKSAWNKTGFARPFLWTYAGLGEDIFGTPAPERRETLKKVLAALNFGPVHNFWPFSEPDGQGGLRRQAKLFREGLTYLAPKCVIFLGDEEITDVTAPGKPELFKVISYLDAGILCVHLPDIHELAVKPDLLEEVVSLFREKLAHLI